MPHVPLRGEGADDATQDKLQPEDRDVIHCDSHVRGPSFIGAVVDPGVSRLRSRSLMWESVDLNLPRRGLAVRSLVSCVGVSDGVRGVGDFPVFDGRDWPQQIGG